ncbi:MAG TPA: hypothetical protein VG245_03265, partial [Candidatus Dormibacteraeota bacterium]|nr:hypothetical protein [Candidatus Dormibacteraeota bacterium]
IALASHERAATGLRILGLRVPFSALPMGCLSLSAMIGFPLDDLWHRTYGIDVTMWSPTHLMMIGAASFTPVAMALMLVEGGRAPRRPGVHRAMAFRIAGAALVGLSTFQLEFDLGIPQWQALYQPVLIMAAGGLALVAARAVLGRGAALLTAVSFLVIRGMWALLIGFGLGHTLPRFPLYLGVAASVELGFWLGRGLRPLPRALVVGACVGTLGLASEWAFSQVWGRHPWQAELLPHLGVAVAAAIAAAVIGMAAGRVMAYDPRSVPLPAVLVAAAALVALLAVPFPRTVAPVSAHLATAAAGPATLGVDQYGMPALVQPRTVTVTLTPAGAASGADQFEVISWQGGGARNTPLRQVAPGRFAAAAAVPTGGTWKSLVILTRGSEMMAVPVYMPASPDYGQAEIAAPAAADLEFAAASRYLIRPRDGDPGPARAITAAFFTSSGLLALLFLGTFLAIGRQSSGGGPAGAERGPKAGPTSGRPRPRLAGVVATADGPGL